MTDHISIAIDGPAAAGKSTVAKYIADQLSYIYIDTGAMYRALTYKALKEKVSVEDESSLAQLFLSTDIKLSPSTHNQQVLLDGIDVTNDIRSNEVTNHVSFVARHQEIRKEMVKRQRLLGKEGGVVMDGRDIGTHVLPEAEVKIFLSASVEERAKRRYAENVEKGMESNLEDIAHNIALRDKRDAEREVAPLIKAPDAHEIDTTGQSVHEVVTTILNIVRERS